MLNRELDAAKKLTKARSNLIMDAPFFGNVAMHLEMCHDDWGILPYHTIATDGKRILYSKEYIDTLNVEETLTEIVHEVMHVVLKHPLRRNGRDFELWNLACDQAVDHILVAAGYRLPPGITIDPAFKGMTAEEIYRIMLASQKKNTGKNNIPDPKGTPAPKESPITFPPKPKESPITFPPKPKKKPDPGQQQQPGSGQNANSQPPDPNQKRQQQPQPGQQQPPSQLQPIPNVPGAHGLVVDAPIDLKDMAEVQHAEEDINIIIESAAKSAGDLPGALKQIVASNKEQKEDCYELLRDFLEETLSPEDYSWDIPDRMYASYNMYMPGIKEEKQLPQIVFGIDSSGSVTNDEKKVYANKIADVLEQFPCTIKAIYCDTRVRHEQDVTSDNLPVKLEFKGGGGTHFDPVFNYIKEKELDPKAILYFTDMGVFSGHWGEDPGVPVLWMNTCRSNDKMDVPFGKIIPLEIPKK